MTAEAAAPADELKIATCSNCGTLYRVSEERKWCPACSTDAGETIDLGGFMALAMAAAEAVQHLEDVLCDALGVDLAQLASALTDLVVALRSEPQSGQERSKTTGDTLGGTSHRSRRRTTPAPPAAEDAQVSPPETAAAAPMPGPVADVDGDASNAAAVSPLEE